MSELRRRQIRFLSAKAKAAYNYVRGPQPALYRDPKSGATWSGRGRAPVWLASVRDRSRFLIVEVGAPAVAPKAKGTQGGDCQEGGRETGHCNEEGSSQEGCCESGGSAGVERCPDEWCDREGGRCAAAARAEVRRESSRRC
ncbi:H-NS histone family protein [Paraburkholderia fungorum]|uniref:H-NS histone family protein n=1 Tax=Paraburkholderia fungorum TaxID=134537 RepID=UPI00387811E5